jgi:hypothetical protein
LKFAVKERIVREIIMAVGLLTLAPNAFGQNYDEFIKKAQTAVANNEYNEAIGQAIQAINVDGQRWQAYVLAGVSYAKQRNCVGASSYLQIAITRAPDTQVPTIKQALTECRTETEIPTEIQQKYAPVSAVLRLPNGNYVLLLDHPVRSLVNAPSLMKVNARGDFLAFHTVGTAFPPFANKASTLRFTGVRIDGGMLICSTSDNRNVTIDATSFEVKSAK